MAALITCCTKWGGAAMVDPLQVSGHLYHHHNPPEPDLIDLPITFNDELLLKDINEFFSVDMDDSPPPTAAEECLATPVPDPVSTKRPRSPENLFSNDEAFYQHSPKRPRTCPEKPLPPSPEGLVYANVAVDGRPRYVLPPWGAEVGRRQNGLPPASDSDRGGTLSAQSMAARERRKRISDKTHELGRLIPGGNKMNTAEMFQSAANYVRFLQAQVGLLGLLAKPTKDSDEAEDGLRRRLHRLVTSPAVQERLYRAERCIVPKSMVEDLSKDRMVTSQPSISRELGRFIQSSSKDQKPSTPRPTPPGKVSL